FMDCLTRTEGWTPIDLRERRLLEEELEFDFPELYEQPLAAQLETYLSIPYRTIAEHVPAWKLTATVTATADSIEHLPFVVSDLAVVRSARTREVSVPNVRSAALDTFLRDDTRSTGTQPGGENTYVKPL